MVTKNNALLALCFMLFTVSCQKTSPWHAHHLCTGNKTFDSSKLCYTSPDSGNIEIELLQMEKQLYLYLQVRSSPIPPHNGNTKEAFVRLLCDGEKNECIAFRHEGGEKLLVPDTFRDRLIALLLENKNVTIELEGYKTTFKSSDFKTRFSTFQHPLLISNPFRLPF